MAAPEFNTSTLSTADPSASVLSESLFRDGRRQIIAMANDSAVDAILAILDRDSHVWGASRTYPVARDTLPNDPYWLAQENTGMWLLKFPDAWDVSNGSGSVRVAVVDSGVNELPELAGQLEPGRNVTFEGSPSDTNDAEGHGTEVASIIAARSGNRASIAGIAPNVRIVPVKDCCNTAILNLGLQWLIDEIDGGESIAVINMSLASLSADPGVANSIDELNRRGAILVASSGNAGTSQVWFPASEPNVVAVGGVSTSGARHPDSNYGQDLDVAAPYEAYAVTRDNTTQLVGGTSFSAAIISGVAALWQSTRPDFGVRENVTADFLDDIDNSNAGGWNNQTGRGVPNAYLTIWRDACQRKDVRRDNRIDGYDEQTIAYYWGAFYGIQRSGVAGYDPTFDLHPFPSRDGRIDIIDIQSVFALDGATCPA